MIFEEKKQLESFPFDFGRGRLVVERLTEGSFGMIAGSEYLWTTDISEFRKKGTKIALSQPEVERLVVFLRSEG